MKNSKSGKRAMNLHLNQVAHACLSVVIAASAPGAFAAAGFGDTNGPDGAQIRTQTYYAHTPSGVRAAIPAEAAGIMGANYSGNTGTALRKFVDPLPQVGKLSTLKDGTAKTIPVAVPTKWKTPAGVQTNDDYYEIAVIQYSEKLHSDLKKPTTLRGYVQIDHEASNGRTAMSGSAAIPLFYPDGVTPIMIAATDALGHLATDALGKLTGAKVQAKAFAAPHYLGPAIEATRGVPTRLKFLNLLPEGRYDPATGRNGDLFIPVDETLPGAGVGPDGVTRYTQNRALIHLHGGDNPWISDGTPHQWITPAGERAKLTQEMAAAGSPLSVDTFLRGPGAINVPDMNDPGDGAMTYYFPNNQSARLEWYHDHSYGLTRLNVYAGMAAPYVLKDPGQDTMLNTVSGFPTDTIHLVLQDKTFVPDDIKLQDGRWNAKVVPDPLKPGKTKNVALPGAPLWGDAGDMWYPHVYEVNQDPSNGVDGTNPVGRWDWGPYFWPVFPSMYNLPTGGVDDVTLTPEAWMDTPLVNGVAYPTLSVQPRAQRFKILNAGNDRFWNLSFFVADSAVADIQVTNGGAGYLATDTITINSTVGTGATAEPVLDAAGAIVAVRVTNAGTGYSSVPGSLPTLTINTSTGTGAVLNLVVADNTEVKMVPAGPIETTGLAACATDPVTGADIAFPYAAACQPSTWPTDGRAGGVPDPRTAGPKIYQIGNEGGLLPRVAEIAAAPMQYEYNRRSVTVLNTFSHGLFMANAERADVLVDFSGYEGKTLILYSDAPAPVPAFDPRNDHWTGKPDETAVGSVETPKAGFGPNTRTIMQIKVENSVSAATAAVAAAQKQLTAAQTAQTTADSVAAADATLAATALNTLNIKNQAKADAQLAFNSASGAFASAAIATPPPSDAYNAALAIFAAAATSNTLAINNAIAAQTAYNAAAATAATSAANATNAALAVANAQSSLTAALAAQAAVAGGATYTPLDVAGLKNTLPAVYGSAYGQEKPVVAQSVYNDAFAQSWSDAPQADGTKAFATIFTGSLQEPTFKFTAGTPNGGFDKITVLNGGSGYVTPPVPVIDPPPAGGVQATAATTLRVASVNVLSGGAGYKYAPVITFGNTGTGSGAAAVARMQVSKVNITNGGTGYDPLNPPAVTFSAPDGRIAGAIQATGTAVVDASGAVTSIVFTGGNGYTTAPLVAIADSGVAGATRATASTEMNIKSIQLVSNDPNHPEFAGGAGYSNLGLVTVNITAPTVPDASFVPAVATVSGAVADITLTNSGRGYVAVPGVTIPAPLVGNQATAEASSGGGSILVKNKAIQELFDPTFGRMNATLGVEIPFTSALTQTTIPLGYVDPVTEVFADGETQIWKITHNGVDAHPVHFHLLNVQVVNRIGWDGTIKPPMDNEYGWKETVRMNPLEDIVVAVRAKKPVLNGFGLPNSLRLRDPSQPADVPMGFTQVDVVTGNPAVVVNKVDDFGWEYVWHCHILGHEENDFMRPIKFNANEAVPLAPTVTALGPLADGGTVNLIWTDNSQTEYKYEVTRMAVMAPGVAAVAVPATKLLANSTTFSDKPPVNIGGDLLTYAYQVAAIGANGVGATTVAVPVNVAAPSAVNVAYVAFNSAVVNWTDNSVNETHFLIEQSVNGGAWAPFATVASAATKTTGNLNTVAIPVAVGGSYDLRVTAVIMSGGSIIAASAPTQSANYVAPAQPEAPTSVLATPTAGLGATVAFTDNSTTETAFAIETSTGVVNGNTIWTSIPVVSPTPAGTGPVSFNLPAGVLKAGALNNFRVLAVNTAAGAKSTPSPVVTVNATGLVAPAAATVSTAVQGTTAATYRNITGNWVRPVAGVTYSLTVNGVAGTLNGGNPRTYAVTNAIPASGGGAYPVTILASVTGPVVASNGTIVQDTVVVPSNTISVNAPQLAVPTINTVSGTAAAVVGNPGTTSVNVSWNATVSAPLANSYLLQYATNVNGPWTQAVNNLAATTRTVNGLARNTTYYFRVTGTNGLGAGVPLVSNGVTTN
jgi:FtsP/CotA-like multicopper oxidase with cupredoxin domain